VGEIAREFLGPEEADTLDGNKKMQVKAKLHMKCSLRSNIST
jgi:hypothetical protein